MIAALTGLDGLSLLAIITVAAFLAWRFGEWLAERR